MRNAVRSLDLATRRRLWPDGRSRRWARVGLRWARLLTAGSPAPGLRVFYGHDRLPGAGDAATGGTAKIQKLATRFPSNPTGFTLLYLGSTWLPRDLGPLLRFARRRGIPVVVNQNGVGYPAWAGTRTEEVNRPLRQALTAADHVLYQSAFCKHSADLFLGEPRGSWEVLPNAVDTTRFTPATRPPEGGPLLLLGGDQIQGVDRVELAVRTLAALLPEHPDARLLVTGRISQPIQPLLSELDLNGKVELVGRYAQHEAPALFRRAHLLLHTQVNDSCPTLVLEAMACGLPVVHPASGGTVELVGDEAGIAVPHPISFERHEPPAAEALADAVSRTLSRREELGAAARRRTVERFELARWLDRHAELFAELTGFEEPT